MALILNLKGTNGSNGTNGTNGAAGAAGANGATWLTGVGAPSDAIGNNNDLYLRTDTGDVYKKVAGTWA